MPQIFFRTTTALLVATLMAACSTPTLVDEPGGEFADQGLVGVKSSGFEEAFVDPDAGLSDYRVLQLEPMNVAAVEFSSTTVPGTTRGQWQMTPERETTLQQIWQDTSSRAFSDYDLSGEGARVLKISSALTQVAPGRSSSTGNSGGSAITTAMDTVDVSVEFRLYDAESDELVAVIRDRRTVGSVAWSRAAGADLTHLFNSWASLLHTRVSGR